MSAELLVRFVVGALHRGVLDRAVHPLDLTVRPRMVWLRPPALNAVTGADAVERTPPEARRRPVAILGKISELNAVVGERRVDAVGNGLDQGFEDGGRRGHVRLQLQANEGECARPIDRHIAVRPASRRADFDEINVEDAGRIALEESLIADPNKAESPSRSPTWVNLL